jgi:AcrR family transcriptional regulator
MGVETVEGASTRDRILTAALDAFSGRGVDATSLDQVATAVGVRKQTLLYWFPSKERLLFGVIDFAVAELATILGAAASSARPTGRGSAGREVLDADRVRATVDATLRLGSTRPQLLALVREVTRLGPPASTHLAEAIEPLADSAAAALTSSPADRARTRTALLAAGARIVGLTTEAQVRDDLGLGASTVWLRTRRREILESLT